MSSEEINPVAEEANVGEGETNNEVGPEDAGPEEGEEVEEAADEAEEPGLTEEQLHEYFSQYDTTASNTIPIANARDVVGDIDGTELDVAEEQEMVSYLDPKKTGILAFDTFRRYYLGE